MKEQSKRARPELMDGMRLLMMVAFTGWVALTQSATLAAPMTALFTAALLTPRVKSEPETIAEQLHRPFVGIGTTLTALLWLLSTTQPKAELLPTNVAEALVILVGFYIATAMIITSPFVFLVSRLRTSKEGGCQSEGRIGDYASGIVCSIIAYALVYLVLKLSRGIIGPIENDGFFIVFSVVTAPVFGWFMVFTERNRRKRPTEGQRTFAAKDTSAPPVDH